MNPLLDFLEDKRQKYGDLQQLARLMGVTFSGFLRGVKAGTLSTDNCLRLAEVIGEDASTVLRVARKEDVAALIERLYGKGRSTPVFSVEERELIETFRSATPQGQHAMRSLARAIEPDPDLHEQREQIARMMGRSRAVKKGT